jgi:hypothetical protein
MLPVTREQIVRTQPGHPRRLCNGWPTLLRAASPYSESWTRRDRTIGFRLARTGADNPGPIGKKKGRSAR